MSNKTIMLVCSSGMSTSMLVSKMKDSAENKGIDAEIFAVSSAESGQYLAQKQIDIILLGPQVKFMKAQFEKKVEGTGIQVDLINMQDYGMMNGEKVLEDAFKKIGG